MHKCLCKKPFETAACNTSYSRICNSFHTFFSWHMTLHSSQEFHMLLLQGCYRLTLPKGKMYRSLHCPASFEMLFLKKKVELTFTLIFTFFSTFENKWVWDSVTLNPDHRLWSNYNLNLLGKYQRAFCRVGKRPDPEVHMQNHYFVEVFHEKRYLVDFSSTSGHITLLTGNWWERATIQSIRDHRILESW